MKITAKLTKEERKMLEHIHYHKYIFANYCKDDQRKIITKLFQLGLIKLCKNCNFTYKISD